MKPDIPVHRAEEPRKLARKGQAALSTLFGERRDRRRLYLKYDGVYVQWLYAPYSGGWSAWSRTGERLLSAETPEAIAYLRKFGERARAYVGELWIPNKPHAEINGAARRLTPQPELMTVLHDSYLREPVQRLGEDPTPFAERIVYAIQLQGAGSGSPFLNASYLRDGSDFEDMDGMLEAAKLVKAAGSAYDGLILRDLDFAFVSGGGTSGGIYKVKPRPSLDLRVVGEHAEQRETKLGGYITVEYKGVRTDVGSGLTQDHLTDIAECSNGWCGGDEGEPEDYVKAFVGRIAEIEYLELTRDGRLREPVFKAWRFDKEKPDE